MKGVLGEDGVTCEVTGWKGEAGAGDVMCGIFDEEAVTGESLGLLTSFAEDAEDGGDWVKRDRGRRRYA